MSRLNLHQPEGRDRAKPPAEERSAGGQKLLIDVPQLASVVSLSVRTLRRMDACGDIPGRVVVGRRVLFQTEVIREWVRAGLPNREAWSVLQKRNGKR